MFHVRCGLGAYTCGCSCANPGGTDDSDVQGEDYRTVFVNGLSVLTSPREAEAFQQASASPAAAQGGQDPSHGDKDPSPSPSDCTTAPASASSSYGEDGEAQGSGIGQMTQIFQGLPSATRGGRFQTLATADELPVPSLHGACLRMEPFLIIIGFDVVWKELKRSLDKMKASVEAGHTVGQCLDSEAHLHKPEGPGSAAQLVDPSLAMGLIWVTRILGFVADLFGLFGRGVLSSLSAAGERSFERQIGISFDNGWIDSGKELVMRKRFTASLPPDSDESGFFDKLGVSKDSARRDIASLADAILPLVRRLYSSFKRRRLDDSKRLPSGPRCERTDTEPSSEVDARASMVSASDSTPRVCERN